MTCALADLPANTTKTVSIDVTLLTLNQVNATAVVSNNETDFPVTNNTDSELTTANAPETGATTDSNNTTNPNDPTDNPFIVISSPRPASAGIGSSGGGAFDLYALMLVLCFIGMRCLKTVSFRIPY